VTREYGDVNGGQAVQGWSRALAGPYFSGFEPRVLRSPVTGWTHAMTHSLAMLRTVLLVETYRAMSIS
jgi:hypothetical protein